MGRQIWHLAQRHFVTAVYTFDTCGECLPNMNGIANQSITHDMIFFLPANCI